jgi:hypothetical protein
VLLRGQTVKRARRVPFLNSRSRIAGCDTRLPQRQGHRVRGSPRARQHQQPGAVRVDQEHPEGDFRLTSGDLPFSSLCRWFPSCRDPEIRICLTMQHPSQDGLRRMGLVLGCVLLFLLKRADSRAANHYQALPPATAGSAGAGAYLLVYVPIFSVSLVKRKWAGLKSLPLRQSLKPMG